MYNNILLLLLLAIPLKYSAQCDSLNVNYPMTWKKYIEIDNQSNNDYTLSYQICNPTSEDWALASTGITIVNQAFIPVGPNPINTSFGNLDMIATGWDGGLMIPHGSCETFTFDITGSGTLITEDIQLDILAFNNNFSTIYCGIAFLHICESMLNLTGTLENIHFEESGDWIVSNQILESQSVVDYDAKDSIVLNANFEVKLGSVFQAFIDGCGNL